MMKAITLWQPYASLIAMGLKKHETRSWQTTHRGLLAIHAAKTKKELDLWRDDPVMRGCIAMDKVYKTVDELPFGAIVCVVNLVDMDTTINVASAVIAGTNRLALGTCDRLFGNWSAGRFAWRLDLVKRLEDPIPVRGRQGLWNWKPPEDFDMSGIGKLVLGRGTVKFVGLSPGEERTQS